MRIKLLFMLVLGCAVGASAEHLNPEQALERALSSSAQTRAKSLKARQLKQVKVDATNVYVFNSTDNSGYLVTSADDRLRPILGYADSGTIDPDNMSPELAWWLSEYDREIAALMPAENVTSDDIAINTQPSTKSTVTDNYAQWSPVAPLVSSKWNQNTPFNDLCPLYNNSSSYARCVTGCVATAMAQVVYYNKYYKGSGSKSYTPTSWTDKNQKVTFDYAGTSINFSAMKDTYTTSDSGTTAGNAVATLMKACGVGVEMMYTPSESGAYSNNIATALVNYFGYDANGTKYIDRRDYSTEEYEAIIYNELANQRPLCFSGSSASGGHCFVVDGYADNGMFHINWGWGGLSDGYFTLTALNPHEQGIGSSDGGYNYWQNIVTVAKPGSTNTYEDFVMKGGIVAQSKNNFQLYYLYGTPCDGKKYTAGVVIRSMSDINKGSVNWGQSTIKAGYSISWTAGDIDLTNYKPGQYKVYAAYKVDGESSFTIAPPMFGKSNYIIMNVEEDGSTHTFVDMTPKQDIHISAPKDQKVYYAKGGNIRLTMANVGTLEYNKNLGIEITGQGYMARLDLNGETPESYYKYPVFIPVDQCMKLEVPVYANWLPEGKYTIRLMCDFTTAACDDTVEFEIVSGSGPAAETLTSNWTVYDESVIPDLWMKGDTFTHSVKIKSASAQTNSACFAVVLWNKGTNTIAQSWVGNYAWGLTSATIYNISALNDNGEVFTIDVPFGTYDLQYFIFPNVANVNILSYKSSQRRTIRVGEKIGDYVLAPDDNRNGIAVIGGPVGNVEVPETFTVSGSTLPVTEIAEGLYRYSKELTGISLPSSIEKIGTYAFDGCSNLDYVVLNNAEPIFDYVQVIAQNSKSDCAWYVPRGSYDSYKSAIGSRRFYEIPAALLDQDAVYIDINEEGTLTQAFAEPGIYNYSVTNSKSTVVANDEDLNVRGLNEGTATITVTTPAPFAAQTRRIVNVIKPVDKEVACLSELWDCLVTDELLPTLAPGTMRSRNHYIMAKGMHVFDRQPDYAMVTDLHCNNNERMHGFKITGLPENANHANVLNVTGRLVTENGVHSLRVNNVTVTDDAATPYFYNLLYGTFDPASDAAEWLHTYAKLWYVTYDANNNVLTGFSKARSANASELPIKNLNNVELPASSNRYNPVGYIDADSDGNYFFVPTADFGEVSTGVCEIDVDDNETSARYFNLQGVEMHGKLAPGIYVRKSADVATKVVVR